MQVWTAMEYLSHLNLASLLVLGAVVFSDKATRNLARLLLALRGRAVPSEDTPKKRGPKKKPQVK